MIEVQGLVKRYGKHLAVDDLNFTIEEGRIYGFLGPNGAGKSTTMNIMTGYLGATSGKVLINGHDVLTEPAEAKKHIGYLPEHPPLYMEMTVEEYLRFVAELKKIPKNELAGQVEEAIKRTRLSEVQHRLIHNLSKGYKQRVGLAQAIMGFPDIIILDEPTVGLDPKQIIEIRELIRELAKNHTVILSSHILAEVREVCDEIMIISRGKLVANDTPENLERDMGGKSHVEIEVKASEDETLQILDSLSGIRSLNCDVSPDGNTLVKMECEQGADIREAVFWAFAKKELPLLGMQIKKTTLEEIFMELTKESSQNMATDVKQESNKIPETVNVTIKEEPPHDSNL